MTVLTCPTGEQLDRLLADDLGAVEFREISEHLELCAACRQAIEARLAAYAVRQRPRFESLAEPAPDPRFVKDLQALVRPSEARPLTRPAGVGTPSGHNPSGAESPGTRNPETPPEEIGDYIVLTELGRGGMAIVYKAQHQRLHRIVALKMIRSQSLDQAEHRARFRAEAEAVAKLRHRNIVQVYEIGEHQGHPYLVLEYVEGGNLADYLCGSSQEPVAAARFLERAAEAVHFAHQQGIVHRDLKPANILLQFSEHAKEENLAAGRQLKIAFPKLSDFGLAKCLGEDSGLTRTDVLIGTPTHLAPEQISPDTKSVSPACDVYALGVILYEMLTGLAPFVGPTVQATLWMVQHENPVPPRNHQPEIPRELEDICLKCLCKDPAWRYASAHALAEDLRRFREGLPLLGRPLGRTLRIWFWCRRNPVVAGLVGALALSWLLGTAAALVLAVQARQEAARADGQARITYEQEHRADQLAAAAQVNARRVRDHAYITDVRWARRALDEKHGDMARELLEQQLPQRTDGSERRSFEWYYLRQLCQPATARGSSPATAALPNANEFRKSYRIHEKETYDLCFSPDGLAAATASGDQTVRLWEAATGKVIHTLTGHKGSVLSTAFSPDGQRLASGGEDKAIRIWDISSGRELQTLRGHKGAVTCVRFSPDGLMLASCGWLHTIRLWDAVTGKVIHERDNHRGPVTCLAFRPNHYQLASGSNDTTVRVWDVSSGEEADTLQGPGQAVLSVCYSPDGRLLASCCNDQLIEVWEAADARSLLSIKAYAGTLNCVCFSPDSRRLASAGVDGSVTLWDATTGQELLSFKVSAKEVRCVAFSPDGERLAAATGDGLVTIWQATGQR
jgi:WD40 repeat protein/tRNA A-37 threonylcarbamoyl transferase component Bud32